MAILSRRGFTLMEIILAITALGILISALLPSMTSYQRRGRDVTRLSNVTTLAKASNNFFYDKEDYPSSTAGGCVDATALNKYGNVPSDPLGTNNNGCQTLGQYAYGTSALLTNSSDEFILIAKMENPNGGNYNTGNVAGLTGTIQQAPFNAVLAGVRRGSGQYQMMTK